MNSMRVFCLKKRFRERQFLFSKFLTLNSYDVHQFCVETCSNINWYIDCWLLNIEWQIFHAVFRTKTSSAIINMKKGWDRTQQGNGFWLPLEKGRDWKGRKIKPFKVEFTFSFSKTYKRVLLRARSVALSKHIISNSHRNGHFLKLCPY